MTPDPITTRTDAAMTRLTRDAADATTRAERATHDARTPETSDAAATAHRDAATAHRRAAAYDAQIHRYATGTAARHLRQAKRHDAIAETARPRGGVVRPGGREIAMPTTVTGGGSPAPTPTPITHTQPDGSTVITGWQYTCPRCGITTTSKAHPRTMGGRTPEHTCNPTGGGSTR